MPDHEIQRWELMDWIARAYELPLRWPKTPRFKDVLPSDRYYSVVETTAKRFKIDGTSDTDFLQMGMSRAVFSRILIKVAQVREFYTYNGWAQDVSRRFWGAPYIETANGTIAKALDRWDTIFPLSPGHASRSRPLTIAGYSCSNSVRQKIDIDDANKVVRYQDPNYRLRQVKKSVKDTVEEVSTQQVSCLKCGAIGASRN